MTLAEKVEVINYDKIDIDKIEIDDEIQVRILKRDVDVQNLAESIKNIGLIEPIIVIEEKKGKKYKLIVGQRRLLAVKELGWKEIHSKIIKPISPRLAKLISLGENIQRRDVDHRDKARVVAELFDLYEGSKQEKLQKISQALGVSPSAVVRLNRLGSIPDYVWELVRQKKLSQQKAWQITAALLGNAQKIIEAAKKMAEENMTKPEQENIIRAAKEIGPKSSMKQIMKRARELPLRRKITIHVEESIIQELEEQAKIRGFEKKEDLICDLIEQFVKNEGLE